MRYNDIQILNYNYGTEEEPPHLVTYLFYLNKTLNRMGYIIKVKQSNLRPDKCPTVWHKLIILNRRLYKFVDEEKYCKFY